MAKERKNTGGVFSLRISREKRAPRKGEKENQAPVRETPMRRIDRMKKTRLTP
jgi:hypothetical protein